MLLIAGAIVLGVLLGLASGGSLRALAGLRFLWWPLAFVGLILQIAPVPSMDGRLDNWLAVGLLISSYVVLLVFVGLNLRLPGMPLIALGFALNILVISVNGGMPVSDRALRRAYGPGYADTLEQLQGSGGAKHHLERPDDVLMPLADVIPVGPPVRQVFSAGDLVALAGIVWLLAAATRATPRREVRRGWPGDEEDRTGPPPPPVPGPESAPARPGRGAPSPDDPIPG